ncbi:MAG: cupredoxin domain-containing protein [Candidatus Liptonbacteria bacterium]|nr:cupredoxin domain-containing protein [Candidatus Liptonbacteria bacterium]
MDVKKVTKAVVAAGILALIAAAIAARPEFLRRRSGRDADRTLGVYAPTREPVPRGVTVPERDTENLLANIARPAHVSLAGRGIAFRTFRIRAEKGAFAPDTVIVRQGDNVAVEITAVDRDYDFTLPDYSYSDLSIAKGKTARVSFGATMTGKFTFFCVSCGGPEKGPKGVLIAVEEKK